MVTLNGVDLNYRLEGDGAEAIVLINGLADDLETWAEQVPDFLAAGYRVLRFDNRGIGKSGRPKGPYTTAQMASDAKALVDHLGIRDFHLVGVSMGGMIAQEYALAHGGDLRSLAPTPRRGRSVRACSPCGATWRRSWACPPSCAT
jgi:3-oxoadipate enol-lactonase